MSLPPPFPTVSHYRLLELLGRGAMGEVWLAEDTQLPRHVAIKLLPRHLAEDSEAVERLLSEARAAASVDHPNVVTVHEAGMVSGQPYLVMQRVEGETLEQRLTRGAMPPAEAIGVTTAVADALAEVHELGIVHRDLKPSNIMLTSRGPKILDFGLAAVRGQARTTQAGFAVGTPMFMSPEQIEGRPADRRSDLWALGVILYHAVTGAPAFGGDNLGAMTRAVLTHDPPAPSRSNPRVSPQLDRVVMKLLQKDPELRYSRAEELIPDLANCALAEGASGELSQAATEVIRAATAAPRLAVLYFEVMSAEPDDAFLAAGLTEDLIVDLARVDGVRVAARGEVQPYRGHDRPPRTVARELNVDFVVQGSVRRAGQRARISVQLVRASDGHATWAERFDRTLEDLFDVQAEVSRHIVDALEIKLRPAEREMLDRAPTPNHDAYLLYLKGRALLDETRRAANFEAEEYLRRAVDLDPRFALAHAALAECYGHRVTGWWGGLEFARLARPHALRAIELEPGLPEAHMAMGFVMRMEGDAEGLLREIRLAARPDTTDPLLLRWVGWSLMTMGKAEEAVEILERAHRLHPRNYRIASSLTDCYLMLGRKEDEHRTLASMQEVLVELIAREPDNLDARIILAINLTQSGQREAGIAQAEYALAADPKDGRLRYNAACTFAHAGEPERAIEQLRVMVELVPSHLTDWVRRDPDLASLRSHPEFVRMFGGS